jgi:hypothetical protein
VSNFVYDDVALFAAKTDIKAPTNPTRQVSASDINTIRTALDDIRTTIQDRRLNIRQFGALGDNTDSTVAIQAACDALGETVNGVFGGFVYLPKGKYRISSPIVIPNGVGLIGDGPANTVLQATNAFSDTAMIRNDNQTGGQEFAFLADMLIAGNKGGGAICSVAVVDWCSLFVNSYIINCIIEEGSNVGLRVAADGSPGGTGPVYVENCWVARNTGHNLLVEDTAGNSGAATGIVFVCLTSENQGTGKSAIYLKGNGRLAGVRFIGTTHIEMGNPAFTSRTGITVDGCAHSSFDNIQLLASAASITEGILITTAIQNVGLKFEHVYNPNLIATVLRDNKNSVTLGTVNVHDYRTADWTYEGGPKYKPVSGGKSLVFQSSAGVDRAWFDGNGRITGSSANGAGLDVLSDATNDRPLTLINTALDRVFGWNFPSGGGGVLRFRYITGGVDIMQFGTDGTVFHYESPTFQKTALFQQALRFSAEIAPTQITSNQDNYNPTGFSTAAVLLLTSDASRDITGFASPTTGRWIRVYNNGAQNIVLKHETTSTAANRIVGVGAADTTLTPKTSADLWYSPSVTRWLIMGHTL